MEVISWRLTTQSMSLGDFIADMREYDIRTALIDAVLDYMVANHWVWLWRNRDTGETWISVYDSVLNDDSEDYI